MAYFLEVKAKSPGVRTREDQPPLETDEWRKSHNTGIRDKNTSEGYETIEDVLRAVNSEYSGLLAKEISYRIVREETEVVQ